MAINFSNENFVKISCNGVSNDCYPVSNLISSNPIDRRNGFQVEYFIRPPVIINIDFVKYSIDLWYLEIGLALRNHKSNALEIYFNNQHDHCDNLVGKYYQITTDKLYVINGNYKPSRLLPQMDQMTFPNDCKKYINGKNLKHCFKIKSIKIKITSTVNSSVPSLSVLNIYGKPCDLSRENVDKVLSLLRNAEQEIKEPEPTSDEKLLDPSKLEHLAPLEFQDSLTCEMMLMPYRLPSGKHIDKKTLDQYLDGKSIYECVDPFTQLPFTDTNQPMFNDELKARIDLFLQTNGRSEVERKQQIRERLLNCFTTSKTEYSCRKSEES